MRQHAGVFASIGADRVQCVQAIRGWLVGVAITYTLNLLKLQFDHPPSQQTCMQGNYGRVALQAVYQARSRTECKSCAVIWFDTCQAVNIVVRVLEIFIGIHFNALDRAAQRYM